MNEIDEVVRLPINLDEKNIGELVKVQVFRRKGKDLIDRDTLEKYVGILEAFSFDRYDIKIKIQGLDVVTASRQHQLVEIYT
jgi:hypothetical protein